MVRSGVIISSPKSKEAAPHPGKGASPSRTHQVTNTGQYMKRDKSAGFVGLPPGPSNYIVRTPYPLAHSKDDENSK